MRPFLLFVELIKLSWKRLGSRSGLTLLAMLGIVLAVGLLSSASFFAQAVDQVILRRELQELSRMTGRSPFATRIYVFPSSRKPLSVAAAEKVARNIAATLSSEVGLPLDHLGVQVESGSMMILPQAQDTRYQSNKAFLDSVSLVYIADAEERIATVAGEPFSADDRAPTEVLDVWMHTSLAEKMGVHAGEMFDLAVNLSQVPRPMRVAGLWQASDPTDPFWFSDPNTTLRDALLIHRQDYIAHVEPILPSKSRFASWHIRLDDRGLNPAHAREYSSGFTRGMAIIDKYLPGAKLDISPLEPLDKFVRRQTTLTTLLLGFNVPALGFLFYFLVLTSVIIAQWQRRETSILVSRGMNIIGVLGMTLIEESLLFVIGLPLGLGFGMLLARFMGYTVSFLSFTVRPPLPVSFQGVSVPLILIALGISLFARLLPTVQMTRRSVVEQEREHARPLRSPFWQRYYLDILLIAPTAYAYRQLADKGTLALLVQDRPEDMFRDPLLILVPALFVLTTALVVMRLFPLIMRVLDLLAGRAPWITPHLALRQLGRHSQGYINPLLLVIVSLALGIYTLSMAASLDRWLVDRMYYSVGTDVSFLPHLTGQEGDETVTAAWALPKGEFLEQPGVLAVSQVGDYPAEMSLTGNERLRGRFLGIDRLDFPGVTWFRRDFADEALGALMNRLAQSPDNILVSLEFLRQNQLRIGDQIVVRVALDNVVRISATFTIAGVYRYFPTVYQDRVTVIGNLEHLFFLAGATFPHHIWLKVTPDADRMAIYELVEKHGFEAIFRRDTLAIIGEEQARMERVGIFGTLSTGFLAAVSMAILALLVHSYASLQERFYQFGVLRALGLLRRQILGQVILEYGMLTAYGAVAGAAIGAVTSHLFTPFFRVTGQKGIPLPPLIPIIAQDEVTRLASVFVASMIVMEIAIIARAFNRRVFDTLRMGHQG